MKRLCNLSQARRTYYIRFVLERRSWYMRTPLLYEDMFFKTLVVATLFIYLVKVNPF